MAGTILDLMGNSTGFELPDAPGNFSEAATPPPVDKPPVFNAPTPAEQATERARLNFEAGRQGTIAGGASAITAAQAIDQPAIPNNAVPAASDFPNANQFALSPGEQFLTTEDRQAAAKRTLADIEADMIAYKQMPSYKGFLQGSTSLAGQLAGGSMSPENLLFPEIKVGSAMWRAAHPLLSDIVAFGLGQAAVQGVADPLKQAAEVRAGLKKEYDPVSTSIAIPSGFVFGGGLIALNRGASILYSAGKDALAGRLTESIPKLSEELRAPQLPEPADAPNVAQELVTAQRGARSVEPAAPVEPRPEPPVPDGMTRLYRADAPGYAPKDNGQVAFTRDPARAMDTPSLGAHSDERTDISFVDVPENVAIARSSGDHVYLPADVAEARTVLPEPEATPSAIEALRAERSTLNDRLDDIEKELESEADKTTRAKLQAELAQGQARVAELRAKMQEARAQEAKASSDTIRSGAQGEVAPRLKGMGNGPAGAKPGTSRPGAGVASTQPEVAPVENLSQTMRNIADTMNLTVRKGVHRTDSTATYNFDNQIVRLKEGTANGFIDFTHELGHHTENVVGKPLRDFIVRNANVMQTFGDVMTVNLPVREGASEGFGEFMVSYITNRNAAVRIAPKFVQDFRDLMQARNPELLARLDEAHAAWMRYQQAPSRAAGESMVVSHLDIPDKPEMKDPLKRSPLALWMSNTYTQIVNRQHPMAVAVRYLAEEYEKKYGTLLNLSPDKDPVKIMQLFSRGGPQMTVMDLTYGVQNAHTLRVESPSFFSILRRVTADPIQGIEAQTGEAAVARMKAFDSYLIAKWHQALRKQEANGDIVLTRNPTGLTDGDASVIQRESEQLYPHFPALAEEIYAYNKALAKKEFDAGLRTRESLDDIMQPHNHEYVPLRRDMREVTEAIKGTATSSSRGLETLDRHVRTGSERPVLSPTESIMLRNYVINDQMTENWTKLALRDLARLVGGKEGAAIVEEIPNSQLRAMDINIEEALVKSAQKNGWTLGDARDMARMVIADIGPEARVQLYRAEAIRAGTRPIVFGWSGGERFALQLPDGLFGRQIQEVMDSLGPKGISTWAQSSGILMDILGTSANVLRSGATSTLTFAVKNTIRDAFMQFMLLPETGVESLAMVNTIKGASSFMHGDDFYRMHASLGGVRGGVTANAIADGKKIEAALVDAGVQRHRIFSMVTLKDTVEALEISESAGRVGMFRKVYEANLAMGRTERYAMFDAATKARDFIDYGRFGSRMEMIARVIPFLNANVQGLDKFMRTYVGSPTNPGIFFKPKTEQQAELQAALRAKLVPRAVAVATMSAAITFIYKDDPTYQRIPVQLRSQNWIFRVPFVKAGIYNLAGGGQVNVPEGMQGAWMVVPKPWEPATFFNLAEKAVEFVNTGDPQKVADFIKSLRYTMTLPRLLDMPLVKTQQELAANYSEFFNRPIVPGHMQGIDPHLQSDQYTAKFYVALAQGMNAVWNSKDAHKFMKENVPLVGGMLASAWSPMEAQYLMQGVFGDWPRELGGVGGVMKSIFADRQLPKVEDIPGLRGIMRSKMAGGQPLRELYNQIGQNDGRLTSAANSFKEQIDRGDPDTAQRYFDALDGNQRDYVRLKSGGYGPLVNGLHPLDRSKNLNSAVRNMRQGLLGDNGLATLNDPTQRIKLEPGTRDVVVQALNEFAATEARNSLIVQGVAGFKGIPLVPTKPYLDVIRQASPEVARELSARLAQKKVFPIETVREYWPQAQRILRIGGDTKSLESQLKGVGFNAATGGYLGGGARSGRSATDSEGVRIRRGKTPFPELRPEGAGQ